MDEKKQIGVKIWELFLKKHSYKEIAKELGISKSVVSNVINYCLPPNNETIQKDIKSFKEELIKCKKTCEKDINNYKEKIQQFKNKNDKLKEEIEELEEELENNDNELETKITSIFVTFFVTFIILIISYNFLFNQNFLIKLVTLFIIFILVTAISFFATTLIKRFM